MSVYQLVCDEPWFSLIRDGIKPVEGRKNSPKYQNIRVGDIIEFTHELDKFTARVTEIRRYPTLEAYLDDVQVEKALPGVTKIEDAVRIYLQWSTQEEIEQHGFLGIFITPLHQPKSTS